MAKIVTASEVNVQVTGTQSVKALNDELAKSKQLLEEVGKEHGKNSEHYKNAEEGVKFLEGAIADANKELKELGDESLKSVNNEAKKLKGGFDAIGNTGALFEELGGNVGHLGSAMGKASDTANLFSSKLNAFGKLKTQVLGAASAFKGNMVAALGKARVAALAFMGALGIGALIAGIALIVTYWKEISVFLGLSASEAEKLEKSSKKIADRALERLNTTKGMTEQLKLQGLTERQILEKKQEQTAEAIKQRLIAINLAEFNLREQVRLETRNKQILSGILNFIAIPIQVILRTMDLLSKAVGRESNLAKGMNDWIASFVADPDKVKSEGQKAIDAQKESLKDLKEEFARLENTRKAQDQKAATDAKSARDKAAEQKKQDEAERNAEDEERYQEELEKERIRQEQQAARDDRNQQKLNEKNKALKQQEIQRELDANAAKKKAYDADVAAKAKAQKEKEEIEHNAFKAAQAFSGLLREVAGENIKTQKAQAVLQVGIDTASAISSVVASSAKLAGNPVALALNIASGIGIVLANMAKATRILNAPVPESGGAGGFGGGNNDTPQPNIQQQERDNRVYVVETDISNAQQRVNNLNKIGIID